MKKTKLIILTAIISMSLGYGINSVISAPAPQKAMPTATAQNIYYEPVRAIDVAANPTKYLNKHIKIKAKFDKFSTLGLDYKPAYRSSEQFITFLIKRDDVINHTIPLSEMKNFLKRDEAEKYIDLASGDDIEYYGYVFSNALGDAWVEVEKFVVLSSKSKENSPKK